LTLIVEGGRCLVDTTRFVGTVIGAALEGTFDSAFIGLDNGGLDDGVTSDCIAIGAKEEVATSD
jgi:hypothetical protein